MAMKVRTLCTAAVVVAAMWLAGCDHYNCRVTFGNSTCGSTGSGLSQGNTNFTQTAFVYFMDPSAGQMAAEGMDVSNSQTFAPVSSFQSAVLPMKQGGVIAIAAKKFLYIQFLNGTLYGFAITPSTGALTPISNASPYPAVGSTIAADPAGKFLFVGDGSGITMLSIGTDGSLTAVGTPFSTGGMLPAQITTDGAGKYLYALDGTEILAWSYSSSGLVPVSGSPFTTGSSSQYGVLQLASEGTGKFMFGTTQLTGLGSGITDTHVYVFGINSGALVPVIGSPFATTNPPTYIAVDPILTNIYTFNENFIGSANNTQNLDPIEGYSYSSAGALTQLSSSPYTTILGGIGQFDQSGQYLFIVGQETNATAAGMLPLTISSTGALTSSIAHQGAVSTLFAVTDEP